jgi:hypothetical protein
VSFSDDRARGVPRHESSYYQFLIALYSFSVLSIV